MAVVGDIYNALDAFCPFDVHEQWDNVGMLVGESSAQVTKAAVVLDITPDAVERAHEAGAQLIISHHPVIFHPIKNLGAHDPVYLLAKYGMNAICAHTNLDCADGGVNDVLAEQLQLRNIQKPENGFYRLGETDCKTAFEFAEYAKSVFNTSVAVSLPQKEIKLVAVCGGAAMDFALEAKAAGADLFFTGEAKHHEVLDAAEFGLSVAAAGHFATEFPAVVSLKNRVQAQFPEIDCVLSTQTAPTVTV